MGSDVLPSLSVNGEEGMMNSLYPIASVHTPACKKVTQFYGMVWSWRCEVKGQDGQDG